MFKMTPMDWTSLIGPAVIAAAIAAIVSVLLSERRLRVDTRLAEKRFAFEREQAERRFTYDVGVTEAKIKADIALAEKRLALDRVLAAWKRRSEFAEEVLADFYQAREIIRGARSPATFADEGSTRTKADWETEDDARLLNAYFATTERLLSKGEFFAQLQARRYRFIAIFGREASQPYDELFKVRSEIMIAVRMLVSTHRQQDQESQQRSRERWEYTIWDSQANDDSINARLNGVIESVEKICRPVIQEAEAR